MTLSSSNYSHSNTMDITVMFVDSFGDREVGDVSPYVESRILAAVRRFADWIYAQLEATDDYLNSDEYVDEQLADSEAEFDETGLIV